MSIELRSHGRRPILFHGLTAVLFTLFVLTLAIPTPAAAQESPSAPTEITADDVNEIARELWCPLCSGVRLDSCELKACDQMKDEIAIKLADGEDLDTIKRYFVNQYGPQVLGEPPRSGFNLLAWLLPIAVLIGGGIFVVTRGRAMLRRDDAPPAAPPGAGEAAKQEADPYAQRLEEELNRYD